MKTFSEWLYSKRAKNGALGDLAQDSISSGWFKEVEGLNSEAQIESLRNHMRSFFWASPGAWDALDLAIEKYEAYCYGWRRRNI